MLLEVDTLGVPSQVGPLLRLLAPLHVVSSVSFLLSLLAF